MRAIRLTNTIGGGTEATDQLNTARQAAAAAFPSLSSQQHPLFQLSTNSGSIQHVKLQASSFTRMIPPGLLPSRPKRRLTPSNSYEQQRPNRSRRQSSTLTTLHLPHPKTNSAPSYACMSYSNGIPSTPTRVSRPHIPVDPAFHPRSGITPALYFLYRYQATDHTCVHRRIQAIQREIQANIKLHSPLLMRRSHPNCTLHPDQLPALHRGKISAFPLPLEYNLVFLHLLN